MKRIFLSLCEIFLLLCSLIFTCDVHVTYRGFTLVWIFPKNRIFLLSHHFKTTQGLQPDNFSQKTQNINSLSVYPNVFWCSGKVYLASNDLISHIRTALKQPFKKSQFLDRHHAWQSLDPTLDISSLFVKAFYLLFSERRNFLQKCIIFLHWVICLVICHVILPVISGPCRPFIRLVIRTLGII